MDKKVIFIIVLFFLVGFYKLFGFHSYGWDENVYSQTSNYIKSLGEHGFLENLRPVMFPLLLVPFGSTFLMRLLVLAFSIGCLILFYKIAKKTSEYPWIFVALLALYPYFFIGSNLIMAEIPAIFLHLLCVYLFLEKKYLYSGLFGFIAFFTRFQFGIYLPIILAAVFIKDRKKTLNFIYGLAIGSILLIANLFLYYPQTQGLNSLIYPMINQLNDNLASGYVWYYSQGFFYYFIYLFSWSVFSIAAIFGLLSHKKSIFHYLLIIPLAYLALTTHKESRYLALVVPWIIYFMAYGIVFLFKKIRKIKFNGKILACLFVILALLITCIGTYEESKAFYKAPKELYDRYFFALENVTNKTLLTSTPMIKTGSKIVIGYYNENYFYQKLKEREYDYVFYANNSFPCNAKACFDIKNETESYLNINYELFLNYDYYANYSIYKKRD
jgi:hypothetical protein